MSKKSIGLVFLFTLILLVVSLGSLGAWQNPVRIMSEAGYEYAKPVIKMDPQGVAYIAYKARKISNNRTDIYLSSYDGDQVRFIKNVSESGLTSYESYLDITSDGTIHVVWIDAPSTKADVQYVMYRYYNEQDGWSNIQRLATLRLPGNISGFVVTKVEDVRCAADSENNIHVCILEWPAARCSLVSKYGNTVKYEYFPYGGRAKHPDIAVDDDYIHVTWQYRGAISGNEYTILYHKRENRPAGQWVGLQDLKHHETQRPRIELDDNNNPHIVYWEDTGPSRVMFYQYYQNGKFTGRRLVSSSKFDRYHYIDFSMKNNKKIVVAQLGDLYAGQALFYNWNTGAAGWGGWTRMTGPKLPCWNDVQLTHDGSIAVMAYETTQSVVNLISSSRFELIPDPNAVDPLRMGDVAVTPYSVETLLFTRWYNRVSWSLLEDATTEGMVSFVVKRVDADTPDVEVQVAEVGVNTRQIEDTDVISQKVLENKYTYIVYWKDEEGELHL